MIQCACIPFLQNTVGQVLLLTWMMALFCSQRAKHATFARTLSGWTKSTIVSTTVYFWTRNRGTDKPKPHRLQVKVQDVVHVAGQGCEQGVVGPVRTHLGDDDGPQGERQHHGQHGHGPTVTCTLKVQFRLMRKYLENTRDRKVLITHLYLDAIKKRLFNRFEQVYILHITHIHW